MSSWLSIRGGFSADVCCWGKHSACWQGEDFTYENCCGDFIVRDFHEVLANFGDFPSEIHFVQR